MIEAVLVGVLATLLVAEGLDWLPKVTELLVRSAARSLPEGSRDRYYEEWLAEAAHIPGKISRFIFALDLMRAAFVMRNPRPSRRIDNCVADKIGNRPADSSSHPLHW